MLRYTKNIFFCLVALAIILTGASPFYFCSEEVTKFSAEQQVAISKLQKAFGANTFICDSSSDIANKVSDVSGKHKSKKHICDCTVNGFNGKAFAASKNYTEVKFVLLKSILFEFAKASHISKIYNISNPRSPPFIA